MRFRMWKIKVCEEKLYYIDISVLEYCAPEHGGSFAVSSLELRDEAEVFLTLYEFHGTFCRANS